MTPVMNVTPPRPTVQDARVPPPPPRRQRYIPRQLTATEQEYMQQRFRATYTAIMNAPIPSLPPPLHLDQK